MGSGVCLLSVFLCGLCLVSVVVVAVAVAVTVDVVVAVFSVLMLVVVLLDDEVDVLVSLTNSSFHICIMCSNNSVILIIWS